jgi:hypothetical protein
MIRLPRLATTSRTGSGFDDARIPICWRFELVKLCLPTLFDTGSNLMGWLSPAWGRPPWNTRPVLPRGWLVSASQPVSAEPFWTFTTGNVSSENIVTRTPGRLEMIFAGVQAFYTFTITYDARFGRLFLTPAG